MELDIIMGAICFVAGMSALATGVIWFKSRESLRKEILEDIKKTKVTITLPGGTYTLSRGEIEESSGQEKEEKCLE